MEAVARILRARPAAERFSILPSDRSYGSIAVLWDGPVVRVQFQYPTLGSFLWKGRRGGGSVTDGTVSVSYPRIVPMEARKQPPLSRYP